MIEEKDLITVIIPVYNAEKFLDKCIRSVLRQTYHDLQIILIDDGSSDGSLKKCEKYRDEDNRIELVHTTNSGVSATRNLGLSIAKGTYLTFLDSDDWLPKNAIERMYCSIIENKADLVVGTPINVELLIAKPIYTPQTDMIDCSDLNKLSRYVFASHYFPGICAKLFSRETIVNNDIFFDILIKCGEDALFNFLFIRFAKRISIIPDIVYFYNRLNNTSATTKYYSQLNEWLLIGQKARERIFGEALQTAMIQERRVYCGLILLLKLCRDYSNRGLCDSEAIKKIADSCEMFKYYLVESEHIHADEDITVDVKQCYEAYKSGQYIEIYRRYHHDCNSHSASRIVKDSLKKLLYAVKYTEFFVLRR